MNFNDFYKEKMLELTECVCGAVFSADSIAAANPAPQFSGDFYAPGDTRVPKVIGGVVTRFGSRTSKKKKKRSKKR